MADRKCFTLFCFFVILLQLICCEKVPETEEVLTNIEDAINVGKEEFQPAFFTGTLVPEQEEDRPPDNSKGNPQVRSAGTGDPPQGTSEEANGLPRGTPDRGNDVPEEAQSVNSDESPEDSQVKENASEDEATESSDSGQGYFSQVLSNLAAPLFEEEDFLSEENDGPDITDPEDQTRNTIPLEESERMKDSTKVDEADSNDHPQSHDMEREEPAVKETITNDHLEETAGISNGEESNVGSTNIKEKRKLSDEEVEHLRVRKPTDSRVHKKEKEDQKQATVERKQDTDEQSTEGTTQGGDNVNIHEGKEEKQAEEGRGMEKVPQGTAETFKMEERAPVEQERSEMEKETPGEKEEWQPRTTKLEMDNIRAEVRTDTEQEKKSNREQKYQQTEPKMSTEERKVLQEEGPKEVVGTRNEDIQKERAQVNEHQKSKSRNEVNTNEQQERQGETTEEEFKQRKSMEEKERAREVEEHKRRVELLKEQKRRILEQERLKKEEEIRKMKELEKAEEQAKAYKEEIEKQRKLTKEKRERRAEEVKVEKGSNLVKQEKLEQDEEVGQRRAEVKESAKQKRRTTRDREDLQIKNEELQRAKDLRKQRTERVKKDEERQKNEELKTRRFEANQQESRKDPGLEKRREQFNSDGQEQGVKEEKNGISKEVKHLNLEGKSNLHTMKKVKGNLGLGNGRTLEVKEDDLEDTELKMKGEVYKRLAEEEELKRRLDILHQERRKFEEMAEQYRRGRGSKEQRNERRENDKVQMTEERKETKILNDSTSVQMSRESKNAQLLNDDKETQLSMESNDAQLSNDSKAQNGGEILREKADKLNRQKLDQEKATEPLAAVPKQDASKFVDPVKAWAVHRTHHDARTSTSVDVLPPIEASGLGEEDVKVIELGFAEQNVSKVNSTLSGYAAFMKSFREFHNNSARALLSCWPTVRNITSDLLGYIGLDTMFDQLCHDLADVHPAVLFSTFFFGTIGTLYFLWSFMIGRLKNVARGPNPHDILKSYEARARILEEEVHTLEMDKLRLQAERNDAVNERIIVEGELESNKEKIEKTIHKIKKLDSEKQRLIVAVEELRVSIQEKTKESNEKEEEIKGFEDVISELEKKAEVKEEKIRELNEDLHQKTEEKEAAARLVNDLNEKINQLENEKNKVEELMKEDKQKYETFQGEFDDQLLRFNALQQQYEFKCTEVEVLKDCLKQIKRTSTDDGEETEIDAEEMQKRLQDLMDVAKAKEDLQKVEASHQKMSEELESRLKELRDLKENFEMMKEELQMANSKAQEAALLQREKEIELEALQRYFKATEVDLHKKLSAEEAARISSENKLQSELAKSEDAENYRKLYLELKKETETIHEKRKLQLLEADQRAHENFLSYRKTLRELDALKLDYDLLSKRCYELELKSELINTAKRSFMNPDWRRESPNRASPSSGAMSQGSPVPFGGSQMPPLMPANPPPPPPPPAVFNKPMPHPAQVLGMNPHVHPATRGFTTPPPTTGPPLAPQPPHDGRPPMQDMRDRTPPPGPPGRMYANSPPPVRPQGFPPPPPPSNMQYSPAPMFGARPVGPTPPPPPFSSGTRPKPSQLANLS